MTESTKLYEEFPLSLPLELERLIFEMSCEGHDPKHLLTFMLVARRVYIWVKPILYETFVQSPKATIPDIRRFPAVKTDEVTLFVKNLLISEELAPIQIKQFLSFFPNVRNLAIWTNRTDLTSLQDAPEFQQLRLERLSVFVADLARVGLSGRAFNRITHLELIRARKEPWESWEPLTHLPCLTHLLLESPIPNDISHNFLHRCPHLVCLIQLVHIFVIERWSAEKQLELCRGPDHRLVSLSYHSASHFIQDWKNGVQGRIDNWIIAEHVSVARKRKYFIDPIPCWLPNSLHWKNLLNQAGLYWYSTL